MSKIAVWQKTKKVIESCVTHGQLKVAHKMMENTLDKYYLNWGDEFSKDLYDTYSTKWVSFQDDEDEKLLEKMNAKDKDFKKPL